MEEQKESTAKEHLDPLPGQLLKAQEDLSTVLKGAKQEGGKTNLHEHIIAVLDKLVVSCPDRALERFEEVSYLLKNNDKFALEDFIKTAENRNYCVGCPETAKDTEEHIKSVQSLLKVSPSRFMTLNR